MGWITRKIVKPPVVALILLYAKYRWRHNWPWPIGPVKRDRW
jgi:hypothetical protein